MDDFFRRPTQLIRLTLHTFNKLADGRCSSYDGDDGDNNDDTQTDDPVAHLEEIAPTLKPLKILVYDDPAPYAGPEAEELFL